MLHFRSNLQSNWENAQNLKLIQILDFNSSFRNIYMSCLPANLDVKSKPQDHMRQFKLRSRDNYLNYFKIYYTSSETFILSAVVVRLQKYFGKISLQTTLNISFMITFPRIGPLYLVNQKGKRRSWKIRIKTQKKDCPTWFDWQYQFEMISFWTEN